MPKQDEYDHMRQALAAAQELVSLWPTVLDGLDGLVRQTVERGWPEPLARQIVAGIIAPPQRPPQE